MFQVRDVTVSSWLLHDLVCAYLCHVFNTYSYDNFLLSTLQAFVHIVTYLFA